MKNKRGALKIFYSIKPYTPLCRHSIAQAHNLTEDKA